jgi:Ca2+-binding RTX toxin-like protein
VRALALAVLSVALAATGTEAAESPRLVFAQSTETFLRFQAPRSYLCSSDSTGGSQLRVTSHPTARDFAPAARPQGDRIAYVREGVDAPGLWIARPDGTEAARFLETSAAPTWSADGRRLLLVLGDGHVWSIGWPGGDRVRLTGTPATRHDPAASPDGTRIAFVESTSGAQWRLVVLRLIDGHETVAYTAPLLFRPTWSPDSSLLALEAGSRIVTVGADGSRPQRIAEEASAPAFAPVGDTIAFVRHQDVWTMRADGSGQANVTRSPVHEHDPAWQPGAAPVPTSRARCAIVGTEEDDVLVGTEGDDFIYGLGGDDRISALGGVDIVRDGAGNDTVDAGGGNDDVYVEAGRNTFVLGSGADELFFTAGATGSQVVDGGAGNDRIQGGLGPDRLDGGLGRDAIRGLKGPDVIRGGAGDDDLEGGRSDDSLDGGPGNDRLWGGFQGRPSEPPFEYDGYDLLSGGSGNDALFGGWQNDRLFGGDGGDNLLGGAHADYLSGGKGRDYLRGADGDDLLLARDGERDALSGGAGTDRARLDRIDSRVQVERILR